MHRLLVSVISLGFVVIAFVGGSLIGSALNNDPGHTAPVTPQITGGAGGGTLPSTGGGTGGGGGPVAP